MQRCRVSGGGTGIVCLVRLFINSHINMILLTTINKDTIFDNIFTCLFCSFHFGFQSDPSQQSRDGMLGDAHFFENFFFVVYAFVRRVYNT